MTFCFVFFLFFFFILFHFIYDFIDLFHKFFGCENGFCFSKKGAGGDSSSVKGQLQGVVAICGSARAFAALRNDGTVVTWGVASCCCFSFV